MPPEYALRLGCFAGVLLLMALGEMLFPRRRTTTNKPLRWVNNVGLVCVNTVLARLLLPLGPVGAALLAEERSWGLLNNYPLTQWLAVALGVILLDLAIYLQHVAFH